MATTRASDVGVELVALNLHDVEFHATGKRPDTKKETELKLTIGTRRLSRTELIVAITLRIDDEDVVRVAVTYRVRLKVSREPDDGGIEAFWKPIVAQLTPTIVFPYFRETVHSLAAKAGLPLVLPVTNVGAIIDPESITIAPAQDGSEEDETLR